MHGIAPSPPPPAYGTYAFACVVNFGTQVTPWVYAPDGNLYRNAAASLPPGVAQSMQSSVSVNVTACSDVVTTSRLLNESLSACTGTVVQSLATGNLTCVAGCPGAVYPSNSTVSGYACNGSLAATDSLPSTAGGPGYAVLAFGYPPFNCTPGSAAPACLLATPSATAAAGGSPAAAACRAVCATSPAGPFANASLCAAACGGAAFNSAANVSVCPAVCDPAGAFAGTAVCAANGTAALARSFWYNGSACSNSRSACARARCTVAGATCPFCLVLRGFKFCPPPSIGSPDASTPLHQRGDRRREYGQHGRGR